MTETRPPIPASLAHRPVRGGLANALERLAARSKAEGECLVWTGGCDRKGYGRIRVSGKRMLAHRAAWIARHGEPPPDKPHVLHHCDNPPCWKEGHLWVGTDADNAADRDSKGRNGYSKRKRCPAGHLYNEANTYVSKNGKRSCRKCLRSRDAHFNSLRRSPRDWTRCPQGHSLSGDNLYVSPGGTKRCRACGRDQKQRQRDSRQPDPAMLIRGTRIRAAREVLDLSQEQFAARIGIGHSSVSDIEAGYRDVPAARLAIVAEILGIDEACLTLGGAHA